MENGLPEDLGNGERIKSEEDLPSSLKKNNNTQNNSVQKYHFGLISSSFSVNSTYWYHSAPALPTGIGGLTKISTGLGTRTTKINSPVVSTGFDWEILCDLPNGSTVNHPRPDIAISQAGLPNNKNQEFIFNNYS